MLSPTQRLEELAAVSPRAAVVEAWREVERASLEAIERFKLAESPRSLNVMVSAYALLVNRGLLSEEMKALFDQLRTLRNRAAHGVDTSVSFSDAVEYVRLAAKLAAYLDAQEPR